MWEQVVYKLKENFIEETAKGEMYKFLQIRKYFQSILKEVNLTELGEDVPTLEDGLRSTELI